MKNHFIKYILLLVLVPLIIHWEFVPYFGPDSAFYWEAWSPNISIKTAITNTNASDNAFKWINNIVNEIDLIAIPTWSSNVWSDPKNKAATVIMNETMNLLYSDYYDYNITFWWWKNRPIFPLPPARRITSAQTTAYQIWWSKSTISNYWFTYKPIRDLPNNYYPSRWNIIWNWATCFSNDECIWFWWTEIISNNGVDRLVSSNDYFYYNGSIVETWQKNCDVMRRCVWTGCKTTCTINVTNWSWDTSSELAYGSSDCKNKNIRAGCIQCEKKMCGKLNPFGYENENGDYSYPFINSCPPPNKIMTAIPPDTSASCPNNYNCKVTRWFDPDGCSINCKYPTFDKYWMNLLKQQITGLIPRHYPRFREIDATIYMIWWWYFASGVNDWDIKKSTRYYANQVWEYNKGENLTCPTFLSTPGSLAKRNDPIDNISNKYLNWGKRWDHRDDLISNIAWSETIDLIKIWGNTRKIIRHGNTFKIHWQELPWSILWYRYFFNSQSYCTPDGNTCYYAISWWDRVANVSWVWKAMFEYPWNKADKSMTNNPNSDFLSDFHVWEIKKDWTGLNIRKMDEGDWIPTLLPNDQWRILHQVIMWSEDWNLKFSLYWWKIIEKIDAKWPVINPSGPNADCTLQETDPKWEWDGYNDYLQYAQCRWNNPYPLCDNHWNNIWAPFDPSIFISKDNVNVYTWDSGNENPKWEQYNFFAWKIEDDDIADDTYSEITQNQIKETSNELNMLLNDQHNLHTSLVHKWSWENHPYKCWWSECHENRWVVLNWKSSIPVQIKYKNDLDINLMPIQSFTQDNNLTFSWNFDFSNWSLAWKSFIWAVLKIDEENDSSPWFKPDLLNKIIDIKPSDKKLEFVQCLPWLDPDDDSWWFCSDIQVYTNPEDVPEDDWNHIDTSASCSANLNASKRNHNWKRVYRPSLVLNKNPEFVIKKEYGDEENYKKANFLISSDSSNYEEWSFFVNHKFEPWIHRVHIWIFAIDDSKTINEIITASQWAWFMWTLPTWKWTWHASRMWFISASELGLDDFSAAWPIPIYYRSFEFEFTIPEITNLWDWDPIEIASSNIHFNWKWVPANSQMFMYATGANSFVKLNDLAQNVPILANQWDDNAQDWIDADLVDETSEISKSPTLLVENSPMHLKIRPTRNLDDEFWEFSFKNIFNLQQDINQSISYTLAYTYIDKLWNIIWGPKKEFKIRAWNKVLLNHELINNTYYVSDSVKPFINGSYRKNKELRAKISMTNVSNPTYEETIIKTDKDWFFRTRPLTKLSEWETYKLEFRHEGQTVWEYKIQVTSSTRSKPEIINIDNNSNVHFKRPIIIWNAKAGSDIYLEVFTEDQEDQHLSNEKLKCEKENLFDEEESLSTNAKRYKCNKLWDTWSIVLFASWHVISDEYWNFSWQINKDLIKQKLWPNDDNINSINNYFIKAYYENSISYDLISFRFKSNEIESIPIEIINRSTKYYNTLFNTWSNTFEFPNNPKLQMLILWNWEIKMKWALWFEIPSNSILKLKTSANIYFASKWSKFIVPNSGQQKFLFEDITEDQLLETWAIIVSSSQWSEIKFSNANWVSVIVDPKTKIYKSKTWSQVWIIKFRSHLDFYTKDLTKLMQFNCNDLIDYIGTENDSEKNTDLCRDSVQTLIDDNISPSLISPLNWWVYHSQSWKHLFSWNAWPNTKIRFISWGNEKLWSTTTDNNWIFTFQIPDQYSHDDYIKSILIKVDNDETDSVSQEIFFMAKPRDTEYTDNVSKKPLIIEREFKYKSPHFNKSNKNYKTPVGWDLY